MLKYACITGSMGNRCDRFMSVGYKDNNTAEDRIRGLAGVKALQALAPAIIISTTLSAVETPPHPMIGMEHAS